MPGKFRYAASALAAAILGFSAAVAAQTFTDELQVLVDTHPEIAGRRHAVEAARAGVDNVAANYLPKLDITTAGGPQYIDSPVTKQAGGGEWVSVAQLAGVQLSQALFDGFATPAALHGAELQLEAAEFSLSSTRQQVLFAGISAYLDILRQRRLVELARASEQNIKRQLRLEDERVRRGAGIAVDVLQAKSRLQVGKEQRVAFEGALREAVSRYLQLFGRPPNIDAMAEPPPVGHLLPRTLDQAVTIATNENPAVAASLAAVAEAEEGRRLARSGYYPTFDVVAGANYEKDSDLVEGVRTDLSILVRAKWNLFDGFATDAAAARAAAAYRGSRSDYAALERRTVEAVRLAWHALETARERAGLLENGVLIAEQVYQMRRKLRAAGRETVINVLDAENELTRARISLTIAEADLRLATYRLLAGIGRLDRRDLALKVR